MKLKHHFIIIIACTFLFGFLFGYLPGYKIGTDVGRKTGYEEGFEACKAEENLPMTVFTLTRNQLRIKTSKRQKDNTWKKLYVFDLSDGLNVCGARMTTTQYVEYRIWNY